MTHKQANLPPQADRGNTGLPCLTTLLLAGYLPCPLRLANGAGAIKAASAHRKGGTAVSVSHTSVNAPNPLAKANHLDSECKTPEAAANDVMVVVTSGRSRSGSRIATCCHAIESTATATSGAVPLHIPLRLPARQTL